MSIAPGDLVSVTIGAPVPLLAGPYLNAITLTGEMGPEEVGLVLEVLIDPRFFEADQLRVLSRGGVGWANSLNFGRVGP